MPTNNCLIEVIPSTVQTGAPTHTDHYAAFKAKAPVFWGNDGGIVSASDLVSAWNTDDGDAAYTQDDSAKRPTHVAGLSGVIGGNPYLKFNGTASSSGSRMAPNASIPELPVSAFTTIDVLRPDAHGSTQYLFGALNAGTDDSIALLMDVGGNISFRWGDTVNSINSTQGEWHVAMCVAHGNGNASLIVNGAKVTNTASILPVTTRPHSMGATSTLGDAALFNGAIAERMRFDFDVTADETLMAQLGEYLRFHFGFSYDPIAAS